MTKPGGDYSYGIDLIGNDRVIIQNNLDSRMGFETGKLGLPHQTINRFKAIMEITGDSRDIPWNSAKSDVNLSHDMYIPILDIIVQVSRQYIQFLRKNYGYTSELFKERAETTDFESIEFTYHKNFKTVVKEFIPPKDEINLTGIKVPKKDYNAIIKHFKLLYKPKKEVTKFIFNRVLEEVEKFGKEWY